MRSADAGSSVAIASEDWSSPADDASLQSVGDWLADHAPDVSTASHTDQEASSGAQHVANLGVDLDALDTATVSPLAAYPSAFATFGVNAAAFLAADNLAADAAAAVALPIVDAVETTATNAASGDWADSA